MGHVVLFRALFEIGLKLHLAGRGWTRWTALKPVSELHAEVPSVLRYRTLEKLIPGGVRKAFGEQVVKADGSLPPAAQIFGNHRVVCDKAASDELLLYRFPAAGLLPFETVE